MVVFVVKRYAVRDAKKWRYAVRKAKIGRYAVRKGGGGVTLTLYADRQSEFTVTPLNLVCGGIKHIHHTFVYQNSLENS